MTVELQIPDEPHEKLCDLAAQQQKPLVDFLTASLAEYVRSAEDFAELTRRAKRTNPADWDALLAKVPDVPPMPGDELPEGYELIDRLPSNRPHTK